MKLLSLFSGIGAFEKALDRQGIQYELVGFSEIDKYAIQSYCAIHGVSEELNLGDITKIQGQALPKDIDLITYGFPCQDISLAGKQKGLFNEDGSQTRSGLFFEALRIIEATQPKVAIAENVKNLTGKTFKPQFEIVLQSLEEAGYNNYWKVLNAKDFGVPQNRERVFIVSIRKDIDTGRFTFPKGFPLEVRLKDVLEPDVDEKYYLSDEQISSVVSWKAQQKPFERVLGRESICHTLTARGAGENHSGMILYDEDFEDTTNLQEACLQVKEATKKGYAEATEGDSINLEQPNSKTRRGRVGHGVAQTLTTTPQQAVVEPKIYKIDIPQIVKCRKYPVDCIQLCECLRYHKYKSGLRNIDIADVLEIPLTKVEHWFRKDDCFAIPDIEIWYRLKKLLKIETDEFDESIMTFEEKEGVYEKAQRHYSAEGIAPTLTSTSAGTEKIITGVQKQIVYDGYNQRIRKDQSCVGTLTRNCGADLKRNGQGIIEHKINVLGNYSPSNHDASRIVDVNGIAPTFKENHGTVTAIVEPLAYDEQNGYIRKDGIVGTLTTDGSSPKHNNRVIEETLRIRKITPREAFRLMDFSDEDFNACENTGMSNAQLYKQAGNSIVVAVPYYIIKSLIDADIFECGNSHDEVIEDVVEEKISEYSDNKQSEYIFNEKKFIELLLREGIISIKGGE